MKLKLADIGRSLYARQMTAKDFRIEVEAVGLGRIAAGRIMTIARPSNSTAWFWTITGPYASGAPTSGEADSLDAAKAEFKAGFLCILDHAAAASDSIWWHGAAPPRRQPLA